MKSLSPATLDRLGKAADFVFLALRDGSSPAAVIDGLVRDHRASLRLRPDGNRLTCAGVTASCTWSKDDGLLKAWRARATERLAAQVMEAIGG